MANDISVQIGVKGETEFKRALTECQNTVRQLDSALKANAAEYDANADAAAGNAQRVQLLRQALETQRQLAAKMGEAVSYASEKYGEASAQTTRYVVAQNKAREAAAKLERELKGAEREMEDLGRESRQTGRDLERGLSEGAEDAADEVTSMLSDIRDELESISGAVGISATIDVTKNIIEGIQGLQEQAEGYRRSLSYVDQAAKDYGYSLSDVEDHLMRVAAHTGSFDEAAEGMTNLMAIGMDSRELADAVNLLLGAVTKFPQTYKFESLAEALRNTVEEGKAIGQYGELLLALGVDIETFDKTMGMKSMTREDRIAAALGFGANRGLEDTIAQYEEANQKMLEAAGAMLEYQGSLAQLAEQTQGVGTAYTEMSTATIDAVNALLENTAVEDWVEGVIKNITENMRVIEALLNPETKEDYYAKRKESYEARIEDGMTQEEAFFKEIGVSNWRESWWADWWTKMVGGDEGPTKSGEEAAAALMEGVTGKAEESEGIMEQIGKKIMEFFGAGAQEGGQSAVDNVADVAQGVQSAMDSIDASRAISEIERFYNATSGMEGREPGGRNRGGGDKNGVGDQRYLISLNIDGRRFATATAPYMSQELGRMANG
jgi:DNA repair exonuclease SbcCD ATPase subunit